MHKIYISKLLSDEYVLGDLYLGPWAREITSFSDIDDCVYDINKITNTISNDTEYCNKLIDRLLTIISDALNEYHKSSYSNSFWKIMLINWLTCVVNNLNFYYKALLETDKLSAKFIILYDDAFVYNKISHPMQNMDSQEYIHSLVSFLVKHISLNNVIAKEKKLNIKLQKSTYKEKFVNKFAWTVLRKESAKVLMYNFTGLTKSDLFKIRFLNKHISFSNKSIHVNYERDVEEESLFSIAHKETDNEFEDVVLKFIELNLPTTLLSNFKNLLEQLSDYKNKKIGVASSGLYCDEQLIELAYIKEFNKGRIVQLQEAGNGLEKYSSSANFLYKPSDYYLTWGWGSHAGFKNIFITVPSRLSEFLNLHSEEYENILYLTKFPKITGTLYDSFVIYNFKQYMQNRIEFMNVFLESKYKNKLTFKLHHSKHKGFNEEAVMDKIYPVYKSFLYNDNNLKMSNCALVYIDYLSSAIYETMIYNVPTIICLDPSIIRADDVFNKYMKDFEEVGVVFDSAKAAAEQIDKIYDIRSEFWNSKKIQDIRIDFLNHFVVTSNNWKKDLIKSLKNLL